MSILSPPKKVNCIFIADQEKRVNRILGNTLFVSTYIMKTSALPAETSVIPSINKKSYSLRNNFAACRDRRYNPHRGSRPGRNHPDRH